MRAGEVGVTIQATTGTVSIAGASATLRVQSPSGTVAALAATVAGDGMSASYLTQAADFPMPGVYIMQLVAVFASGQTLKSAEQPLVVGRSL